jgi:hypothetical protein
MALTDQELAEVRGMPDGVEGWVEVRVRTDGRGLRLWPDGDRIDPEQASDLVWDGPTLPE